MPKRTVAVPYQSPEQRAALRLRRYLATEAVSWSLVLTGILLAFLTAGQFSREALIGLGIAVAKSLLGAIATFLQHYLSSLSQADAAQE